MTAKLSTTYRRPRARGARAFAQRALKPWLVLYVPFLVLNYFVDYPGLNDSAMSLAGGIATLALVVTAAQPKTRVVRARKPRSRR